jgi:hypothetical protein
MTPFETRLRDVTAEESGAAGDEDGVCHALCLRSVIAREGEMGLARPREADVETGRKSCLSDAHASDSSSMEVEFEAVFAEPITSLASLASELQTSFLHLCSSSQGKDSAETRKNKAFGTN